MEIAEIIITTILFMIAISSFVISYFYFKEKAYCHEAIYIIVLLLTAASGLKQKQVN